MELVAVGGLIWQDEGTRGGKRLMMVEVNMVCSNLKRYKYTSCFSKKLNQLFIERSIVILKNTGQWIVSYDLDDFF